MNNLRIVEKTNIQGKKTYVIEQYKTGGWFHDAGWETCKLWHCSWHGDLLVDCEYSSLEEAKADLCFFDGTKEKQKVVLEV